MTLGTDAAKRVADALADMPAPDRIALARALLAGTPWADALDDAAQAMVDERAAMMGEGE